MGQGETLRAPKLFKRPKKIYSLIDVRRTDLSDLRTFSPT
jgi:hypothetical protein